MDDEHKKSIEEKTLEEAIKKLQAINPEIPKALRRARNESLALDVKQDAQIRANIKGRVTQTIHEFDDKADSLKWPLIGWALLAFCFISALIFMPFYYHILHECEIAYLSRILPAEPAPFMLVNKATNIEENYLKKNIENESTKKEKNNGCNFEPNNTSNITPSLVIVSYYVGKALLILFLGSAFIWSMKVFTSLRRLKIRYQDKSVLARYHTTFIQSISVENADKATEKVMNELMAPTFTIDNTNYKKDDSHLMDDLIEMIKEIAKAFKERSK